MSKGLPAGTPPEVPKFDSQILPMATLRRGWTKPEPGLLMWDGLPRGGTEAFADAEVRLIWRACID